MPWIVTDSQETLKEIVEKIGRENAENLGEAILVKSKHLPSISQSCKKFYVLPFPVPALTVDTIILRDDGAFVMIKRNYEPFKDYWALPGGFVEIGETVEEAAMREAREETGIEIKIQKLVGVYSDPSRDPRRHTVSICFLAKPVSGELKSGEEGEVKWFTSLPEKIAFDHEKMLRDAGVIK